MNHSDENGHFDTAHLDEDIAGHTVRGGALTAAAQVFKSILEIGSTLILARILAPADFGLIGMVIAVTGFIALFKDLGQSMATIQRRDITHEQISTLFWINVLLSVVILVLTVAISPILAWFYDEPRLIWITIGLAGAFIFSGLTVQHDALL
ncbi:MAG: oligosaccharide flippase family protein, partial [Bradymonadaceae bacterium]